jgi:hypothetical protein
MLVRLLALLSLVLSGSVALADSTKVIYLSGTGSDDTVEWDFKVSGGRQSGEWMRIPVPSNWEMEGFGTHRYGQDWERDPAPDHTGWYRHAFLVPEEWQGLKVELVFGAAMTDTEVTLNGQAAGPVHQGGFYQFRHDVSQLIHYGRSNQLEVTVKKFSADRSVNRAERQGDYWLFGGIYRPVWLEARPAQHIVRSAIDARHTGEFAVDVYLGGMAAAGRVVATVEHLDGAPAGNAVIGEVHAGAEHVRLRGSFPEIAPWSAEWPNRYRLRLRLQEGTTTVHEVAELFGFRTVELRQGDGLYVNGEKVRLKGVNRHTAWPTTGRATNRSLSVQDVSLIKEMNMNAVRMSHYPPDSHFLDVADELGLYVIDELAGWQKAYDFEPGRPLVREMIIRDVNHPSIILWANGNEGGWNVDLVPEYAKWDPQQRVVIHPWSNFNGLNTSHYEKYGSGAGWFFHGRDVFLPTEFLHGLYDGGHGAGLADWWDLMLRSPLSAGGFLWVFADEGIVRADLGGKIDVSGNAAPDGIVGPFREKEGSFFAIKEIWSPVHVEEAALTQLPPSFGRRFRLENRYHFTRLDQVRFFWQLVDLPAPDDATNEVQMQQRGEALAPAIGPGERGWLPLDLPDDWARYDSLQLTAVDPHGREIYTWTWMIPSAAARAARIVPAAESGPVSGEVDGEHLVLRAGDTEVRIAAATGQLAAVTVAGTPFSLAGGPRLVGGSGPVQLTALTHGADGDAYRVTAEFEGQLRRVEWRLLPHGWLRLNYQYRLSGTDEQEYHGVTFDYP